MNVDSRQSAPLHEGGKPLRERVREDRRPVVASEYAANRVLPVVAARLPLGVLPSLVLEEHREGRAGQLQRPGRGVVFRRICVDPGACCIVQRIRDRDRLVFKVNILPAQAEQLATAQAGEQVEGNHGAVLDGLLVQQLQKAPGIGFVEVRGFLLLHLRQLSVDGRIVRNIPPLDCLPEA